MKNKRPWDLMNCVKKCQLSATEALQYNRHPYTKLEDLWQVLHQTFNSVQNCQVNLHILDEIPLKPLFEWPNFSKEEFGNAIKKCNNSFSSRPNYIFWRHLKAVINNDKCLSNIVNIINACIDLGHWPSHFKISTSIIIPKSNKASYNSPKMFYPIILLDTLGKLIKKVIGEKLQYQSITSKFVYLN